MMLVAVSIILCPLLVFFSVFSCGSTAKPLFRVALFAPGVTARLSCNVHSYNNISMSKKVVAGSKGFREDVAPSKIYQ